MKFWRLLLWSAFAFVLILVGVAAGFWAAGELDRKNSLLARIEKKASGYLRSAVDTGDVTTQRFNTTRLPINISKTNVPLSVADNGGGLGLAPDGALLLLDRTGAVFQIVDGQTSRLEVETPDNNFEALKKLNDTGGFEGRKAQVKRFRYNDILSVAAPDGVHLFLSYSDWRVEERCMTNTLAHLTLPAGQATSGWRAAAADWRIVHRTSPCIPPRLAGGSVLEAIEAGGRLAKLSDDEIVWSNGSYGRDDKYPGPVSDALGQRDDSDYGRLLKVNFRTDEITELARGLRNPQGLAVDPEGGIWVTDHGMRGGDELNYVPPGAPSKNFGFPVVSYGTHYNLTAVSRSGRHEGHDGFDLPIVAFVPSVAPGAALYLDGFHPDWEGDVLVGDYSGAVQRVHVVDGRAMFVEPIPTGVRSRDMQMTADGKVAIWTDNLQIVTIEPAGFQPAAQQIARRINKIGNETRRAEMMDLAEGCLQCHGFDEGDHQAGPSLNRVCGRAVASTDFQGYSDALLSLGGDWDRERLAAFIQSPEDYAPGTNMVWTGVEDEETAVELTELICSVVY